MARRTFPSGDSSLVYAPQAAGQPLLGRVGTFVTIYTDAAATNVATDLQTIAGAPVSDGRFLVDATSRIPRFKGPDNVTVLYAKPDGSSVITKLYADAEENLTALTAAIATFNADADAKYESLELGTNRRAESSVFLGLVPTKRLNPPAQRQFVRGEGANTPTIAAGGSGYAVGDEITYAGGTFTHPTIVKVATIGAGGAVTTVSMVRTGNYTVRQPSPTLQDTTTGTGTGVQFTPSWNSQVSSTIRNAVSIGPLDSRIRFTGAGPANISGSGYYGQSAGQNTACVWEWETDSTQIDIRQIGLNTLSVLYVDDVRLEGGKWTTDASGAGSIYSIDWGGSARMRRYRLVSVNSGFGGFKVTATAVVQSPQAVQKPLAYGLGDSYMFGTGAEDISTQAFTVMCEALGLEALPDGVGGAGYSGTTAADRINQKAAALTRTPAYVFLDMGFNNAGGSQSAIATAFDGAVAAARAAWPAATLIAFGPATPLGRTTNLDAVRDTIQARAAAATPPIPFVDVGSYVHAGNKALYTGADNTHPTPLGHKYLGARKALAVRPLLPTTS